MLSKAKQWYKRHATNIGFYFLLFAIPTVVVLLPWGVYEMYWASGSSYEMAEVTGVWGEFDGHIPPMSKPDALEHDLDYRAFDRYYVGLNISSDRYQVTWEGYQKLAAGDVVVVVRARAGNVCAILADMRINVYLYKYD